MFEINVYYYNNNYYYYYRYQAIVPALIIVTKENKTQQPYQGIGVETGSNLDWKKHQVILAVQGISP